MRSKIFLFLVPALFFFSLVSHAQNARNASQIKSGLERLNVLGTILYFAAHPDDENTRLIAWLANEKKYRTAYLSLTRGDGGQNLIGNELGVELGLIRTQELLAARRIDGGEQYFSSAYDFGFSKTHEETFNFWNKEQALREAVWMIRKLRPDVIINRFPPDKRGGHGHHQASAILSREAFEAAGDPDRFPEQLDKVDIWKPKRLLWNTANFGGQNNTSENQLKIEIGTYNPLLGYSYGEIASLSRSQHKSQGFGSAAIRGNATEYFEHVTGEEAKNDLFDGLETSWSRLPGTEGIGQLVRQVNEEFNANAPQKSITTLIKLHQEIQKIDNKYWKEIKTTEVEQLILDCAGFYAVSYTSDPYYVKGSSLDIKQEIIVRNPDVNAKLLKINTQPVRQDLNNNVLFRHQYSTKLEDITQPYWLRKPSNLGKFDVDEQDFGYPENRTSPSTLFQIEIDGLPINVKRAVVHKFVDPVRGEVQNPIQIVPALTANADEVVVLLNQDTTRSIRVTFVNHSSQKSNKIRLDHDHTFSVTPNELVLDFDNSNTLTRTFAVEGANNLHKVSMIKFISENDTIREFKTIQHDHIPSLSWFPKLSIRLQPIDLKVTTKKVGYIAGAGDLIPQSLQAIGIIVEHIAPAQITASTLAQFDAVVFGVRAYNVSPQLASKRQELLDYANNGGVVVVQYNVNNANAAAIGPYPFDLTRARVTEEDALVKFLLPKDPVLQYPNKISEQDFDHWVQERGLYFAENTGEGYRKPLAMHDKGEEAHDGSLLIAKHGKGKFVYTSLSFFRQLPAGVPGAYRLFVNLLASENNNN